MRLDARGAEHRLAARDRERAIAGLPARLHLAVVQSDPQPRLAWCAVHLVDQVAGDLGERHRVVVVHPPHGVTAARCRRSLPRAGPTFRTASSQRVPDRRIGGGAR